MYLFPDNLVSRYTRNQGHIAPSVSYRHVSTAVRAGLIICRNALFDPHVYILR
jgi:hypothetical protein